MTMALVAAASAPAGGEELASSPDAVDRGVRAAEVDPVAARLRTAGWAGVAATVALAATSGVFALTARARADSVSAKYAARDAAGQPLPFDARTESAVANLRADGREADRYAIGFIAAGAVTAIASAALFTAASLRRPPPLSLSLSPTSATLSLSLPF